MSEQDTLVMYLLDHGPTDTRTLAMMTGIEAKRAGHTLRVLRDKRRWGVRQQGHVDRGRHQVSVWVIDRFDYEQYLEKRRGRPKGVVETKPRNRVYPKGVYYGNDKKDAPPRVFNTPYKTVWQPCSPFYKETA